jgi:dTDP-4-amino-4,6-dideoxygalactose transaminase
MPGLESSMTAAITDQWSGYVPLLDLNAQNTGIQEQIFDAIRSVCTSQTFILGPQVAMLEQQVAGYSECRFGVGVSSGTDALLVALMALGVGPGDEVVTTPYAFFGAGGAVARLGARPVFCDIDRGTFNLSVDSVAEWIRHNCTLQGGELINHRTGGRVKAIMPVYLFGQIATPGALMDLARENRLRVIEDAAQAIGAEASTGRRAGSIGDIGCFSFFPSTSLGAFGDGGMCITNDALLAERMKILRAHGEKPRYHHAMLGGSFPLDEIQAAVLLVKLKYLDSWINARQRTAAYYEAQLTHRDLRPYVTTPMSMPGCRHVFSKYVIRAERRDELRRLLTAKGIATEIYCPIPLHMQTCFESLGYRAADCPESVRAAQETLAIPIYPQLTVQQLDRVIESIAGFYLA